jgi:hypothetical protein
MLLVQDATFDQMPGTGVAAIGVEREPSFYGTRSRRGVVTTLADDIDVLAIVHGADLAARVRDAITHLGVAAGDLRCTFLECEEAAAFDLACKLYHRDEGALDERIEHPALAGHACPVPLCDGT